MKILLISDDASREVALRDLLHQALPDSPPALECAAPDAIFDNTQPWRCDIILLDLGDGATDGLKLIEQVCRAAPQRPIVVMGNQRDDRLALIAIREGVQDYVDRNSVSGRDLWHSMRFAVERFRLQSRIRHLAFHDDLTGLPNRILFSDRLEQLLERAHRQGQQLAVHFLDLDRFKMINDTYGHQVGDQLLCAVAQRIKAILRAVDTVARLGGDEFAILQSDVSDPGAASLLADRIIQALASPFELHAATVEIRVTIGIAIGPVDGAEAALLLRHADQALYAGKEAGRNTYRFYAATQRRDTLAASAAP